MFTHEELLKQMPSLGKFAIKLTRNRDDAEDLVQSTIVTALSKNAHFEQGTNLFSWMSRIMFNGFVSRYRKSARFETQFDPQLIIDQQAVEASQENDTDVDLVGKAMMALSDSHQEILRLVCVEGMQYAEVAEMLQIPVGTVRSRLSRAREGLQEKLNIGRAQRAIPAHNIPAQVFAPVVIHNEADVVFIPEFMNMVAANQARKAGLTAMTGKSHN